MHYRPKSRQPERQSQPAAPDRIAQLESELKFWRTRADHFEASARRAWRTAMMGAPLRRETTDD